MGYTLNKGWKKTCRQKNDSHSSLPCWNPCLDICDMFDLIPAIRFLIQNSLVFKFQLFIEAHETFLEGRWTIFTKKDNFVIRKYTIQINWKCNQKYKLKRSKNQTICTKTDAFATLFWLRCWGKGGVVLKILPFHTIIRKL